MYGPIFYIYFIIAIIFLVVCLVGICADIAIIYTIFRFTRIRTASNIFLANWAIADLISLILIPVNYGAVIYIYFSSFEIHCFFVQALFIIRVTEILFGIVLSIDWCFAAYFPTLSQKFQKHYRYVIASVWVVTLLFYGISSGLCVSLRNYSFNVILFGICYVVNIIFVIALQCSRIVQRCRTLPISYPKPLRTKLTLISVITLNYLLAVISLLLIFFEVFHPAYFHYILLSIFIAACAILLSSVVTLILLCCLNYDFRRCLFQIRKPLHEQFDNPVSETENTVKSPPEISFHTATQSIMTNGNQNLVS